MGEHSGECACPVRCQRCEVKRWRSDESDQLSDEAAGGFSQSMTCSCRAGKRKDEEEEARSLSGLQLRAGQRRSNRPEMLELRGKAKPFLKVPNRL